MSKFAAFKVSIGRWRSAARCKCCGIFYAKYVRTPCIGYNGLCEPVDKTLNSG